MNRPTRGDSVPNVHRGESVAYDHPHAQRYRAEHRERPSPNRHLQPAAVRPDLKPGKR